MVGAYTGNGLSNKDIALSGINTGALTANIVTDDFMQAKQKRYVDSLRISAVKDRKERSP